MSAENPIQTSFTLLIESVLIARGVCADDAALLANEIMGEFGLCEVNAETTREIIHRARESSPLPRHSRRGAPPHTDERKRWIAIGRAALASELLESLDVIAETAAELVEFSEVPQAIAPRRLRQLGQLTEKAIAALKLESRPK